jgi:hypothetical protein
MAPLPPANATPEEMLLWSVCLMVPGILLATYLWWKGRKR